MTHTTEELMAWIGRSETTHDGLAPAQAAAAAATFDMAGFSAEPGHALPPLWHWFYFHSPATQAALSSEGHPRRGGFLPPIALPRRMYAGGRLTFVAPLVLGAPALRTSTILDVSLKEGRSGPLAFVRVGHRCVQEGQLCVEEEHDIVYREMGGPVPAPVVAPPASHAPGTVARMVHPDTRLLFRFSALTFNAHRIHYDRDYARNEEGYPGLVVHGPLIAMQLISLAQEMTSRHVTSFEFRSERPLFDLAPYEIHAQQHADKVTLEAVGPDGLVAQRATARVTATR